MLNLNSLEIRWSIMQGSLVLINRFTTLIHAQNKQEMSGLCGWKGWELNKLNRKREGREISLCGRVIGCEWM